jgi:hypothetical protein
VSSLQTQYAVKVGPRYLTGFVFSYNEKPVGYTDNPSHFVFIHDRYWAHFGDGVVSSNAERAKLFNSQSQAEKVAHEVGGVVEPRRVRV